MAHKTRAIVIHEKDTVAVALEALPAGIEVAVGIGEAVEKIRLASPIPVGHKFALLDMPKGVPVIKYGEPIGLSTAPIVRGEHVHVHNLLGQNEGRKGDLS
jgi:altronate dehydratase small subunit